MKKFILSFTILFVLTGFSTPAGKGIDFFKGSWKEALAESKKTGKPVFIDVYATWCGPCKKLQSSFKNKEAGEYFNKNFINVRVNGETAAGNELMSRYAVNSYPTLLILDANGKQLARATGYMKPYILVNFGRRVIP